MRHRAIYNLYPNVVTIDDGAGALDSQGNQVIVDEAAVAAEIQRLEPIKAAEQADAKRKSAYISEADPLFFKAQRGEATMQEWQAKVAEIKIVFQRNKLWLLQLVVDQPALHPQYQLHQRLTVLLQCLMLVSR